MTEGTTKIATLETVKGREIEPRYYGTKSFQNSAQGPVYAEEYGFESLQYILDEIEEARRNNWDRTILLTGDEGGGKSTLAAWIATELGLTDEEEVCYAPKQYLKTIRNANQQDVTWLDEGVRGLYSRDAMSKVNKQLTKAFTQIRVKELVSIICLPHKKLLDSNMRERRIHYWGDVRSRGYKRGYVKWRIAGKPGRKASEKKIPKHQNEWDISVYWEPLFLMRFPKLRENNGFSWSEYERVKKKALDEFLDEESKTETPSKVIPNLTAAIKFLKEHKNYSAADISKITNLSKSSVYRYLKYDLPDDITIPDESDLGGKTDGREKD